MPKRLNYLTVCSGVEAFGPDWCRVGLRCVGHAEIDAAASAVLRYHFPNTPNHGDFTTITRESVGATVDVLAGGTPCQDFSVAGLRAGLAGDKGNLTLEFVRLADRLRPRWIVWENVPGVLSDNGGRSFGAFLSGLAECGYGFAYRVLDAQYYGIPQRRRRVFVIGYLGDWRPAAAVLFDAESLRGDTEAGHEAGQGIAAALTTSPCADNESQHSRLVASAEGATGPPSLTASNVSKHVNNQTPLVASGSPFTFDTRQITSAANRSRCEPGAPCSGPTHHIGFTNRGAATNDTAETLRAQSHGALPMVHWQSAVRRLTPRECERLMGYKDFWTATGAKPDGTPFPISDTQRYRMCGNGWATPVAAWIGCRLMAVEAMLDEIAHANA